MRDRARLLEGTRLSVLETERGVILVTRQQLEDLVRADLSGLDLVEELLEERRQDAAAEDQSGS